MITRKKWPVVFVIFLFSLIQLGCDTATQSQSPPFKIAYFNWPGFYPVLIGIEKGFFNGIDVQAELLDGSSYSQFLGGEYDAMTSSLGDVINLNEFSKDIRVILITDFSNGGDAIIATSDIQTIDDLAGQKVGANFEAFGYPFVFISTMLEQSNLTMGNVEVVYTAGDHVLEAIEKGEIVAGHTWEPYVTQGKQQGLHVIFDSSQTPGLIPDLIVVREQAIQERPDDVQAFVTGWFQAVDFWLANPQEGNEMIAKALNIPSDTISLEGIELLTLQNNITLFANSGDNSIYQTAEIYVDFFKERSLLSEEPAIDKILDATFLNKP